MTVHLSFKERKKTQNTKRRDTSRIAQTCSFFNWISKDLTMTLHFHSYVRGWECWNPEESLENKIKINNNKKDWLPRVKIKAESEAVIVSSTWPLSAETDHSHNVNKGACHLHLEADKARHKVAVTLLYLRWIWFHTVRVYVQFLRYVKYKQQGPVYLWGKSIRKIEPSVTCRH